MAKTHLAHHLPLSLPRSGPPHSIRTPLHMLLFQAIFSIPLSQLTWEQISNPKRVREQQEMQNM